MNAPFFLLARRPGWRRAALLTSGVEVVDGDVRLARPAPRSVFDCPAATALDLPGCCRAVVDVGGRRVVLVSGTGQIVREAGPSAVDGGWQPVGLVARPDGRLAVLDAGRLVHVLDHRLRHVETLTDMEGCPVPADQERRAAEGRLVTTALDSGLPGCVWHRVVLTGDVPLGCQVEVSALMTDADQTEAEVALLDDRWVSAGVAGELTGAWDALVAGPPGRYLWLRLTLRGDGRLTPSVHDVEVHFPRVTSLSRLPAVFAAGESDFLERFLALTDTVRASVTDLLDAMAHQLDPRSADSSGHRDFLAWLGGWVGMDDIDALPVPRRRRLIAAAPELYRRRGTPDGVARHCGLWLGRRTEVLEHYRLRRWAVANGSRLGDASVLFGPEVVRRLKVGEFSSIGEFALVGVPSPRTDPFRVFAHAFTLLVYARRDDDAEALTASARRVLAAVVPAHCAASVCVVTASATVGVRARLGLDAMVAGPPPAGRVGDAVGLALAADPRAGGMTSIGIDARVGTRAIIG